MLKGALLAMCPRCGMHEFTVIGSVWHDFRCWGLKCAVFNLWYLVRHA